MKNGCNEILEAKVAERNEHAKKLYRHISDMARRIGETTTASRSMVDLFSTQIEVQRQKLRDKSEKLLFLDPLNYGKKTLELLWRKVYYDTVYAAKKLRETETDYDDYLFTHIVCGIGHFHHFIERIQLEFKVQIKELDYMPLLNDKEFQEISETPSEDDIQFGRTVLHSCLIYLGDLSRYQSEIFHTFDPSIAARYYLQAAHLDTSSGMPYNQLGNLYLDKNYNLDSVCYYIHCLSCVVPFEGALGNLTKIFEKNTQLYENLHDSSSLSQSEHIQYTVAQFLSLIEIWYMSKNDTNIPQRCNAIAQELKVSLEFDKILLPDINKNYVEYTQAIEDENLNPSYFNNNLVLRVVQICLLTITKVNETDELKAFACKAFTLALLSQLLQKILKHLEDIGLTNPAHKYKKNVTVNQDIPVTLEDEKTNAVEESILDTTIVNGHNTETGSKASIQEDNNDENITNGDSKISTKKPLSKRRRRRRVNSSDSSDMSDAETESSEVETDKSYSNEDLSDTSYDSECDSQSGGSCNDTSDIEDGDKKENGTGNVIEETSQSCDSKSMKNEVEVQTNGEINNKHETKIDNQFKVEDLQQFLLGDNFLPSIKLLQDWVLTEKDLILSCGDSGDCLFQNVVNLLNIFSFYFNSKQNKNDCELVKYVKYVARKLKLEYKSIPLPEDICLRGTNICKFDKDAAEWQILDRYKPSTYEENVIRILHFIDFGNQIAKIVPRVKFNRTMKIFYLKKIVPPKLNTKINHKRSREWHNSKKQNVETSEGGLLRRLGRLWLASQVRELERSGQVAVPTLLALDTTALHKHLRRVKQLLRTRNFTLLVPTVVLQELDDLKRERSTARDAIRWLEVQLRSGSRFLRTQRNGESKPLPLLKYPRKAPPHVHNFIQILEFCNHFTADDKQIQGGNGDAENSMQAKSMPLFILLVGNEPGTEEERFKEFSLMGAAQSAGIAVEFIGDFYTKWRQTVHKSGKKR